MSKNINELASLNQILDNTIEGIIIVKDGFIRKVNQPVLNITKYQEEDLIGNLATGILLPTSKNKYIEYNSTIFQEITMLTKESVSIPSIIKIKDLTINETTYKMVSILDLSEIKQKEKLLIDQSKLAAMGEMISVIAHQWRQPLNSIASITSRIRFNIKKNKLDKDLLEEKTEEIQNQLKYMSNTIDDFKNFFKPKKDLEAVNLLEIVNDSKNILKASFEAQNIAIIINNKKLQNIKVYKNEYIQVLLNLFNNAKDAFLEKNIKDAKITVNFYEDNEAQILKIKDNAGGIPENIIENIFTPYFSTKKEKNGTGLGLYISKIIVEKYLNGEISVKNDHEGAIFTIKLLK